MYISQIPSEPYLLPSAHPHVQCYMYPTDICKPSINKHVHTLLSSVTIVPINKLPVSTTHRHLVSRSVLSGLSSVVQFMMFITVCLHIKRFIPCDAESWGVLYQLPVYYVYRLTLIGYTSGSHSVNQTCHCRFYAWKNALTIYLEVCFAQSQNQFYPLLPSCHFFTATKS